MLGGISLKKFARAILPLCLLFVVPSVSLHAETDSPFAKLAGRWTGEGMLGLKDSPPERVKCRATYFVESAGDEVKQAIRCATSGGKIEVLSNVKDEAGKLTGHWMETTHDLEGDLNGEVTPKGFRITVRNADLTANMDIVVRGNKQIVEIQFINSSLVGLSLIMTKG
jgi:hypothetical protein